MSNIRKANIVTFWDGPMQGVCYPVIFNPDKIAFLDSHNREWLYECDQEERLPDGSTQYRMVLTRADKPDYWQEWRYATEGP